MEKGTRPRRRRAATPARDRVVRPIAGLLLLCLGCAQGVEIDREPKPLDAHARARIVRRLIEDARSTRDRGRTEEALEIAGEAAALAPSDAVAVRLHATLLEAQGRIAEARRQQGRADALAPPEPPLPDTPLSPPGDDLLVVLLPPSPALDRAPGTARRRALDQSGAALDGLAERLRIRLPGARVHRMVWPDRPVPAVAGPPEGEPGESVDDVRRWLAEQGRPGVLTLRIERARCGRSTKDGDYGLARLRTAYADLRQPARAPSPASNPVQYGFDNHDVAPAIPSQETRAGGAAEGRLPTEQALRCASEVAARALEQAIASLRRVPEGAAGSPRRERFERAEIRRLFPDLGLAMRRILADGRRHLATGDLAAAHRAFARARQIDPQDADAAMALAEVERTRALAAELARRTPATAVSPSPPGQDATGADREDWPALAPNLTPAQLVALEAQLASERERRDDLLATLSLFDNKLLENEDQAPNRAFLAALRPSAIVDPEAEGPRRARARLAPGATLETRVLHAPEGDLLARYYFASGDPLPILMEEDSNGDGRLDRWVAYRAGIRAEVWERGEVPEQPDIHLVYGGDGRSIDRIEVDHSGDGESDRVFTYRDGRLESEARDTNGDHHIDTVQHFGRDGSVVLREEDLDGDGEIDLRSIYQGGRLKRREIMNPKVVVDLQ